MSTSEERKVYWRTNGGEKELVVATIQQVVTESIIVNGPTALIYAELLKMPSVLSLPPNELEPQLRIASDAICEALCNAGLMSYPPK